MDELRMLIDESFHLQDERTVLLGRVTSGPDYIPTTVCLLEVDGEVVQELTVEGEMLPKKRAPDQRRVVATTNEITVDRERLGGAVLRSVALGDLPG